MKKVLGNGQHLVKVSGCDTDLTGNCCVIIFRNSKGVFNWKIDNLNDNLDKIQMFLTSVNIWFNGEVVSVPLLLQKGLNAYLLITISESPNGVFISNCKHPCEVYKYHIIFPPSISLENDNEFVFKFYLSNSDGGLIGEVEMEAIIERKYFRTYEDAERYLMHEYNEIQKSDDYRYERRILFKTDRHLRLDEAALISISGNDIFYYNELKHRNVEGLPYQVEVYAPDTFGDVKQYKVDFKTEEAARNFIASFDGYRGDGNMPSYARLNYLDGKITKEYQSSLKDAEVARKQFDDNYINNISENLGKSDQDITDSTFDGDPDDLYNII